MSDWEKSAAPIRHLVEDILPNVVAEDGDCAYAPLRYMMWKTRHDESGNLSHGRSVLDYLRSRQEEFSIVSPNQTGKRTISLTMRK